jgi:hypothetical protein
LLCFRAFFFFFFFCDKSKGALRYICAEGAALYLRRRRSCYSHSHYHHIPATNTKVLFPISYIFRLSQKATAIAQAVRTVSHLSDLWLVGNDPSLCRMPVDTFFLPILPLVRSFSGSFDLKIPKPKIEIRSRTQGSNGRKAYQRCK